MASGVILFESDTIVAIATGISKPSANDKTGAMVQIWILPIDINPVEAVKSGQDGLVCGDCPLKSGNGCYVNIGQAPLAIWKAYKRGAYPRWNGSPFARPVRLGAYGDLCQLPSDVALSLVSASPRGFTCYTHGWRTRPDMAAYAMASVETDAQAARAHVMGFRTFRTGDSKSGDVLCPATSGRIKCENCLLCNGNAGGNKPSIYIPAHGATANKVRAVALLELK